MLKQTVPRPPEGAQGAGTYAAHWIVLQAAWPGPSCFSMSSSSGALSGPGPLCGMRGALDWWFSELKSVGRREVMEQRRVTSADLCSGLF